MEKLNTTFIKKFYNKIVVEKYKNNYEFYMWFSNRFNWERYKMNYHTINFHLKKIKFNSCIELGPGPGIWTKLLIHKNPNAQFTLFDISKEMLNQSKINLGERTNIEFINDDFTTNPPKKNIELFFSSRVIEYIPSKEIFFEDLDKILVKGSNAVIITKMPQKYRQKIGNLLMKKTPLQHTGKISPDKILNILKKYKYSNVEIYPAIIAIPFLKKLYSLNNFIWKKIYKTKLKNWMKPICESYVIKIKK